MNAMLSRAEQYAIESKVILATQRLRELRAAIVPMMKPADPLVLGELSAREFQVLLGAATGKGTSRCANEIFLSVKTVSTYRDRVAKKFGIRMSDLESLAICLALKDEA